MANTLDVKTLVQLLHNHQLDEAKKCLSDFFAQPLTAEERGNAQFTLAATYLELQTEVNEVYTGLLTDAIKRLTELSALERQAKDRMDIARVKSEIDQLAKKA
jgi:hypothetical protein